MSSKTGEKIGAIGRRDAWLVNPAELYSPRSDPKHPEHESWKARTDPNDPDMIALVTSMRENGTDEGTPIVVYSEGGRTCIACGDRRHAAVNIVNRERRTKKEAALPLRALTTKDPVAARNLENACRKDDAPMWLARRYRASKEAMGDAVAAASMGLTLSYANALLVCLSLPADIQAKVNSRELPPDVAARVAKKGGAEAVAKVAESAKDASGKVDPGKARAAAKDMPKRHKAVNRDVAMAMANEIATHEINFEPTDVAALVLLLLGDRSQADGKARRWLADMHERALVAVRKKGQDSDADEAQERQAAE